MSGWKAGDGVTQKKLNCVMPIIMTFPLIDAGFIYRLNSLDKGSFTLEIFLLESLGVFAQRHITCETQGKICLVQSNFD